MDRLYQTWLALTGKLHTDQVTTAKQKLIYSQQALIAAQAETNKQLRRAEEIRILLHESEEARRQSSNALGTKVIKEMLANHDPQMSSDEGHR